MYLNYIISWEMPQAKLQELAHVKTISVLLENDII